MKIARLAALKFITSCEVYVPLVALARSAFEEGFDGMWDGSRGLENMLAGREADGFAVVVIRCRV